MMERHAVEIIYAVVVFLLPGDVFKCSQMQYNTVVVISTTMCAQRKYIVDNGFIFVYNLN